MRRYDVYVTSLYRTAVCNTGQFQYVSGVAVVGRVCVYNIIDHTIPWNNHNNNDDDDNDDDGDDNNNNDNNYDNNIIIIIIIIIMCRCCCQETYIWRFHKKFTGNKSALISFHQQMSLSHAFW